MTAHEPQIAAAASAEAADAKTAGAGAETETEPEAAGGIPAAAGSASTATITAGATASDPPALSTADAGLPPADMDAGTAVGSELQGVTIVTEGAAAQLNVSGASCTAGRCTLAAPPDGKLMVALSLTHDEAGPMPVLARWRGCGEPETSFFPVTPGGSSYVVMYQSEFQGLQAGAKCTAEIVEGGWLVFAGNMSLQIVSGEPYCQPVQASQQGVNVHCFAPPDTRVAVQSDLPQWDCVSVDADGAAHDATYKQQMLELTSVANQLMSCVGAAQSAMQ